MNQPIIFDSSYILYAMVFNTSHGGKSGLPSIKESRDIYTLDNFEACIKGGGDPDTHDSCKIICKRLLIAMVENLICAHASHIYKTEEYLEYIKYSEKLYSTLMDILIIFSRYTKKPLLSKLSTSSFCSEELLIDIIIESGVDINGKIFEREYDPPLIFYACAYGLDSLFSILINHNAKCDYVDDGTPLLHLACYKKADNIVNRLARHISVDINKTDGRGDTVLYIACKNGFSSTATALIRAGADINKTGHNGYSCIHVAAKRGHLDIVELLLQNNANTTTKTDSEQSIITTLNQQVFSRRYKDKEKIFQIRTLIEYHDNIRKSK